MMRYYPVNLNINGKKCVVVGGGKVAERKIKNILFCGGKVKVISPDLTFNLHGLAKRGKISCLRKEYKKGMLKGAYLVFAATSSRKVNSKIAKGAVKFGVLVNVCDSAKKSTFILPAVLRKKGMILAVSTGGASPEKSVRLRDRLGEIV